MTITTRPAEREDILRVVLDLSPQSVADIKRMQMGPDEVLGFFGVRVPEKDAVTFIEDGKPIAIVGWDKEPDAWYSWLLTTPQFYRSDPSPVFASRRHLRRVQKENPSVSLMTVGTGDSWQFRRWMLCLGFYRLWQQPELNVWKFAG